MCVGLCAWICGWGFTIWNMRSSVHNTMCMWERMCVFVRSVGAREKWSQTRRPALISLTFNVYYFFIVYKTRDINHSPAPVRRQAAGCLYRPCVRASTSLLRHRVILLHNFLSAYGVHTVWYVCNLLLAVTDALQRRARSPSIAVNISRLNYSKARERESCNTIRCHRLVWVTPALSTDNVHNSKMYSAQNQLCIFYYSDTSLLQNFTHRDTKKRD